MGYHRGINKKKEKFDYDLRNQEWLQRGSGVFVWLWKTIPSRTGMYKRLLDNTEVYRYIVNVFFMTVTVPASPDSG